MSNVSKICLSVTRCTLSVEYEGLPAWKYMTYPSVTLDKGRKSCSVLQDYCSQLKHLLVSTKTIKSNSEISKYTIFFPSFEFYK